MSDESAMGEISHRAYLPHQPNINQPGMAGPRFRSEVVSVGLAMVLVPAAALWGYRRWLNKQGRFKGRGRAMTPNRVLEQTVHQRRFACWFPAARHSRGHQNEAGSPTRTNRLRYCECRRNRRRFLSTRPVCCTVCGNCSCKQGPLVEDRACSKPAGIARRACATWRIAIPWMARAA